MKRKLIVPANLNLYELIKPDEMYSYITYTGGNRKKILMKKGKLYYKYFDKVNYFITQIITGKKTSNRKDLKDYVCLSGYDLHPLNYRQIILIRHFLHSNKIIDKVKTTQRSAGKYTITEFWYKLNKKYNQTFKTMENKLQYKQSESINDYAKKLIEVDFVYEHMKKNAFNYQFDYTNAFNLIEELKSKGELTDKQYVSYYNHILQLKYKNLRFTISENCNRVFTHINTTPKILRQFFYGFVEIDMSASQIHCLIKYLQDLENSNLEEEIKILIELAKKDFYNTFNEEFYEKSKSRGDMKGIVLWTWINGKSFNKKEYKEMKFLFPNITKELEKRKVYFTDNSLSNELLKIESKAMYLAYYELIKHNPSYEIYTIHDSIMIKKEYTGIGQTIITNAFYSFFGRTIPTKIN